MERLRITIYDGQSSTYEYKYKRTQNRPKPKVKDDAIFLIVISENFDVVPKTRKAWYFRAYDSINSLQM